MPKYTFTVPEFKARVMPRRRRPVRRGLKKYEMAGGALAGVASMAARQALNWYGRPRQTQTTVKSGYRPRRGYVPRKKKTLKKQVKELKRYAEADMGTHIYRHKGTTIRSSAVGFMNLTSLTGVNNSAIESAMAGLRYYDPASPATLVTAAAASGTYQKEFLVKRQYSKYLAVNNYQVPAMVTLYVCVPKSDTSLSPQTTFTNGLADVGNPTSSSPLVYLTDSPQFNDLWRIAKSKKAVLQPGESMMVSYSCKEYMYDPSLVDSHSEAYQSRFGAHTLTVRIEGVLGHDSAAAEYGTLQASVDVQEDRVFEIHYAAGADIKTVVINDVSDTSFTNGGVVSNKPVSDNQSYSVA